MTPKRTRGAEGESAKGQETRTGRPRGGRCAEGESAKGQSEQNRRRGRGGRVCGETAREGWERGRASPKKDGRRRRGRRGSSARERCATDTTPENVAQRTPSPRKPSQGHQAQEMPNHGRGVKRRTGPLRANGAIASQEQSRTSRIPSASAPKVKHCGHA